MALRVLVPAHFVDDMRSAALSLGVELIGYDKEGKPLADSTDVEALFRWWLSPAEGDTLIEQNPSLRWIHSGSAGVDHILTPRLLRSNITLTNSSGVHAVSIAEWVVAAMLSVEKDLTQLLEQQKQRIWEKVERSELAHKHVVFLGAGRIAEEIATRLRPFGMRLTAVRREGQHKEQFDSTRPVEELREVVADCGWLIVAVPLTPSTLGLVDASVLSVLPPSARIVNVSRGEIVDEEALIAAIRERRLAGAVLDVFRKEPLPAEHPFWSMPEVIVLPHTTWRSPQVRDKQMALFVENLRRFVSEEPLLNVVDRERGY